MYDSPLDGRIITTMGPKTPSIHSQPTVLIFMGVAGCGKSTAAADFLTALCPDCTPQFLEGDDFHSLGNKSKMASGVPLTDDDRWPWLTALGAAIADALTTSPGIAVATCSALKRSYRRFLASAVRKGQPLAQVVFVWLDVPQEALEARLLARKDHYMGVSLLASQLATLEQPTLDSQSPHDESFRGGEQYRVARVDCGFSAGGAPPSRAQVLDRVIEAVYAACPDQSMLMQFKT